MQFTKAMYRHTKQFYTAALAAAAIAILGCDEAGPRRDGDASARPDSAQGDSARTSAPRDESITGIEYAVLGMPDPRRVWSQSDIAQAAKVLSAIAAEKRRGFPRYQSDRSGEVFSRLTSLENLRSFQDTSTPLEVRIPAFLEFTSAYNQIFKLYLLSFQAHDTGGIECIEVCGTMMHATVVMIDLINEALPSFDPQAPDYEVRMRGVEQMRRGLASIVTGSLVTLTEVEAYSQSDLARHLVNVRATLPRILPAMTPNDRTETIQRLDRMLSEPTLRFLEPGLSELRASVDEH